MAEPPTTIEEIVKRRRNEDLPTHIYVTGSGKHFREDVTATARTVAEMIAGEKGDILEEDFDKLELYDVALLNVTEHAVRRSSEDVDNLRRRHELVSISRASSYGGIVAYCNDINIKKSDLKTVDALIEVGEDGINQVSRIQVDGPKMEIYLKKLDGITS